MVNDGRDRLDGVDSISALPDEILQHILSYIPTKFSIQTSVLSKRWKHVWSNTPSLSFYMYRVNCDSIDETLTRYTAKKMTNFQLCISRINKISYMSKWIELAVSRNVENISLDLGFPDYYAYDIADLFYISSSVKQLTVGLRSNRMKISSCSVSWTSLKKLSLQGGIFSNEWIARILSGCPILESLTLHFISCLDELIILDLSKSLHLRTLDIELDVSSLTEASLDIQLPSLEKLDVELLQVMVLKMLEKLGNVEKLTLGSNFLKIISRAELQHVSLPMFNVKSLMLKTMVSQYVIPGIVMVLQNSPDLKKLTLHIKDGGNKSDDGMDKWLDLQGLNSDQCWGSRVKPFVDIISKNVESKHVVSLMEFMLQSTKTLEKMVVRLKGHLKGRVFEELLVKVPMIFQNNENVSILLRK